ncbi:hypothetical protein LWP59_02155 [Amycolatopsis acidiphila]|uniref:Uncharacterized protein n=1 Tax=Amycolatopsis acidiphila TaxID=715473 RepID=A0A557ZZY6_9PSEU|nr:hypothetical protein [Amycolatopsis acidiphila]TVT17580.1 hypothetical protein FNH06_30875 [Amycolatopsis acidiphila]UIJ60514.1 hypothetical protein LWP59_02155 [Amycolatopsis acidiphila]GHG82411.1 hypothetical protein GCM10017788_52950 [Amycolatopsis acidiphila]
MNTQPKLHRPWRALVALAEIILAAVAVWLAFPLWAMGLKTLTVNLTDGVVLTSTRYIGSWMAAAIGLGLLAALLLVDAIRELLLAVHAKHRAKPREQDPEGFFEGHLNEA